MKSIAQLKIDASFSLTGTMCEARKIIKNVIEPGIIATLIVNKDATSSNICIDEYPNLIKDIQLLEAVIKLIREQAKVEYEEFNTTAGKSCFITISWE